jgi:hypothetical protein
MSENHEGRCLCGSVQYRTTGEPTWIGACHCRQCQRLTGTAFSMGVYFLDTDVEIISGSLNQYEYRSDESGGWHILEFCKNCGTNVTWTGQTSPGERGIAIGTFDDPNWLDVKRHSWTRSAHRSVIIPHDAVSFEKGPS